MEADSTSLPLRRYEDFSYDIQYRLPMSMILIAVDYLTDGHK